MNIKQIISGTVRDFREIENLTIYLAREEYNLDDYMGILNVEEHQRLGYVAEVAAELLTRNKEQNSSLENLRVYLNIWRMGRDLQDIHFTKYSTPVNRNALSHYWHVISDYSVNDFGNKYKSTIQITE